jgi:hypothetical protein
METMIFLEQSFNLNFAGLAFDLALIDTPQAILALVEDRT